MLVTRAQWPHTIDDITNSLDGIWGLVGAVGASGNLFRLERSLHQPLTYTLVEYEGHNEERVLQKKVFDSSQRDQAIKEFSAALGLSDRDK